MERGILIKYESQDGIHAVMLEDNGRVAYAYLLENDKIVADVWLYNRCVAQNEPEWKTGGPELMPFANAAKYIEDSDFELPGDSKDFSVVWGILYDDVLAVAIFIRGRLHALLGHGTKPGYCCLAVKNGPVAQKLNLEIMNVFHGTG